MRAPLLPVLCRLALTLLPIAAAGCHDHDHGEEGPQADEYVVDCETAATAGTLGASDENFQAVVNAEAAGLVMTTPASKLPQLTAPAAGTMLAAATPPTFSFTPTMMAARLPAAASGGACRMAAGARRSPLGRALAALASELVLERRAQAHCAPQSGEKFLLRLATAAGAAVYTAMLSVTSFTPDAAIWSRQLASHKGETLTVTLERAVFTGDAITDGPYAATPQPTFAVAP